MATDQTKINAFKSAVQSKLELLSNKKTEITGEVSSVTNIFGGNINAVQIGIQSRPGSLFIINQEPIYLGRSGVYEVNNGTIVTSVGVAAPGGVDISKIQDFILDYAVNEEG